MKMNGLALVTVTLVILGVGSLALATTRGETSHMTGRINTTTSTAPSITGSLAISPMIAKTMGSEVRVSIVNASTIAEKVVGPNAHAVSVRIAPNHGYLVYTALVVDSKNGVHTVLVDAGNGKILSSTPVSIAAMLSNRNTVGSSVGILSR